jgi:hypothetical protein
MATLAGLQAAYTPATDHPVPGSLPITRPEPLRSRQHRILEQAQACADRAPTRVGADAASD